VELKWTSLYHFFWKQNVKPMPQVEKKMNDIFLTEVKNLYIKKEQWKYQDRYVGFDPFGGQEIVWEKIKLSGV